MPQPTRCKAYLVERDVAVGTDTAQEEVDTAHSADLVLVLLALGVQVLGVSVQQMRVLRAAQESAPL